MPKSPDLTSIPVPHTIDEPSAADLTAFLVRLSRPGAQLRIITNGSTIVTRQSRASASGDAPPVADAIVKAARAAGYLFAQSKLAERAEAGPCEVLSPAGRAAARVALMAQPSTPGSRRGPLTRGARRSNGADVARSQRPVERMAVVEQLGHRRDAHGQPLLSEVQVAAALRLAQDFAIAQLQPRVTAGWSAEVVPERRRRGAPGAGVDVAAATAAAQERVRAALVRLGGELASLALDVCCFELGLEAIEAARRWPSRTGRVVLGIALSRLAEHYGLAPPAQPRHAATRHWGDDEYKPTADAWTRPGRNE